MTKTANKKYTFASHASVGATQCLSLTKLTKACSGSLDQKFDQATLAWVILLRQGQDIAEKNEEGKFFSAAPTTKQNIMKYQLHYSLCATSIHAPLFRPERRPSFITFDGRHNTFLSNAWYVSDCKAWIEKSNRVFWKEFFFVFGFWILGKRKNLFQESFDCIPIFL